jgi:hypothetical protein
MIPRRHQVLDHPQAEGEVIVLLGAVGLAEENPVVGGRVRNRTACSRASRSRRRAGGSLN